jgi:ADP-ribose pyrophosphatase YjhB (NUDIX family)
MYEKYTTVLSVGAFIFNEKNDLLIVKKSSNEQIDADLWTIPGGKIYPEEHILVGLKREVMEEVGLEIEMIKWIGEDVFQDRDSQFHAEHFMCKAITDTVVLEHKLTEYKWIRRLSDISNLPFAVNIKKRITEIFSQQI